MCTWGQGQFDHSGNDLNKHVRGSLGYISCKISKLQALLFWRRRFLSFFLFFLLVAMATRFQQGINFFEQLWKSLTRETILPSLVEIGLVVFEKKIFEVHYIIYIMDTRTHTCQSLDSTASQMLGWHTNMLASIRTHIHACMHTHSTDTRDVSLMSRPKDNKLYQQRGIKLVAPGLQVQHISTGPLIHPNYYWLLAVQYIIFKGNNSSMAIETF